MADNLKIGILAIQGDYEAHSKMLDRLDVPWTYVRRPEDIDGIDGIILPGGESTTHIRIMREEGVWDAMERFAVRGGAFFGTCAGAILLAREVHNPPQASLALLDISILRNGYGRQLASDVHEGQTKLSDRPIEMVFIRAPIIQSFGKAVDVLAADAAHPVLVQEGPNLAATFHPELTDDPTVHRHFIEMVRRNRQRAVASTSPRHAASRVTR